MARGTPELVLVSGYSGIGKSSVVDELHKANVLPRGIFISGKFDQYKRDIPYATFAQAFETLVRQILSKNELEIGRWGGAIRDALGLNAQLVVNLIPELELIIGKQAPVAELPPQEAQNRFQATFRAFLGVFARKEHPLALFLDDLQWLDAATLKLFEHLVTHSDVRHFLLIGAYRDNEVSPSHPLCLAWTRSARPRRSCETSCSPRCPSMMWASSLQIASTKDVPRSSRSRDLCMRRPRAIPSSRSSSLSRLPKNAFSSSTRTRRHGDGT